jgi:hypothetical protein
MVGKTILQNDPQSSHRYGPGQTVIATPIVERLRSTAFIRLSDAKRIDPFVYHLANDSFLSRLDHFAARSPFAPLSLDMSSARGKIPSQE